MSVLDFYIRGCILVYIIYNYHYILTHDMGQVPKEVFITWNDKTNQLDEISYEEM